MSIDARVRAYWREEFSLIALLLLFFVGHRRFGYSLPFDARLFPLVIGSAGILLCTRDGARSGCAAAAPAMPTDRRRRERSGRERRLAALATALLSAPVFGLVFWLFGFFVASLAAMLLMPPLMGYSNRRTAAGRRGFTVAVLAVFFPVSARRRIFRTAWWATGSSTSSRCARVERRHARSTSSSV